jgi:hypothetical protein
VRAASLPQAARRHLGGTPGKQVPWNAAPVRARQSATPARRPPDRHLRGVQNSAGNLRAGPGVLPWWLPPEAGDDAVRMGPALKAVPELRERPGSPEGHAAWLA